jgi:hypothetical protein
MVPGEGSGPNVCRFGLSGWRLRDEYPYSFSLSLAA